MPPFNELIERIENLQGLDGPAGPVSVAISKATHEPPVSSLLGGTWLGHPVHPALTDLPIGFWTTAFFLDLFGGKGGRRAARRFVGLGVVFALPTAATGLADWADTGGGTRHIGMTHGLINTTALTLYALSWRARRRSHTLRGIALSLAGATLATAGAYLGGHLVYRRGIGVDVNVFTEEPHDWTRPNKAPEPLEGATGLYVEAGEARVVATRTDGTWYGIGARCSHRGGPLQEGTFQGGCVTCPWHNSRFRLTDGEVIDGPASVSQPRYEVRDDGESVAVRAAPSAG